MPLRFFIVTFLWSWFFWIPFALVNMAGTLNRNFWSFLIIPALFLGAFGPAIGACYSVWTLKGKDELGKFLKSFLSIRFGWKVWLSIFGIFCSINFLAWYIPELFGHARLPMLLPSIYVFPAVWVFMVFLGGGQEEIGWRGYLMPFLESRYGLFAGNMILGVVWSLWHIPLWFIPETNQIFMPFSAFVIEHIGLSFFLSWVIRASNGKPLSGLIAHGTANAFISLFPTFIMEANVLQIRIWIYAILILVVGAIFKVADKRRLGGA